MESKQPSDQQRNQKENQQNIKANEKCLRFSKSNSKREIYSDAGLHQETRKISNNLILHLKILEEQQSPKLEGGK